MMKRIQRSLPRKHPKKPLRRKRKMGKKKMMIKPMWHIMEKDILNFTEKNLNSMNKTLLRCNSYIQIKE